VNLDSIPICSANLLASSHVKEGPGLRCIGRDDVSLLWASCSWLGGGGPSRSGVRTVVFARMRETFLLWALDVCLLEIGVGDRLALPEVPAFCLDMPLETGGLLARTRETERSLSGESVLPLLRSGRGVSSMEEEGRNNGSLGGVENEETGSSSSCSESLELTEMWGLPGSVFTSLSVAGEGETGTSNAPGGSEKPDIIAKSSQES